MAEGYDFSARTEPGNHNHGTIVGAAVAAVPGHPHVHDGSVYGIPATDVSYHVYPTTSSTWLPNTADDSVRQAVATLAEFFARRGEHMIHLTTVSRKHYH